MHFIYVASGQQFVKVGITTQPKARAKTISHNFRQRGDSMQRFFMFPSLPAGYGAETEICNRLAEIADRVDGREWFTGVSAAQAIEVARPLVMRIRRFQLRSPFFRKEIAKAQRISEKKRAIPAPKKQAPQGHKEAAHG